MAKNYVSAEERRLRRAGGGGGGSDVAAGYRLASGRGTYADMEQYETANTTDRVEKFAIDSARAELSPAQLMRQRAIQSGRMTGSGAERGAAARARRDAAVRSASIAADKNLAERRAHQIALSEAPGLVTRGTERDILEPGRTARNTENVTGRATEGALNRKNRKDIAAGVQAGQNVRQTGKFGQEDKVQGSKQSHATSERKAGQRFTTDEREAGEDFTTLEREEGQDFTSDERIAGQDFTSGERIASEKFKDKQQKAEFTQEFSMLTQQSKDKLEQIAATNEGRTVLEKARHDNKMARAVAEGLEVGTPEYEKARRDDVADRIEILIAEGESDAATEMKLIYADELLAASGVGGEDGIESVTTDQINEAVSVSPQATGETTQQVETPADLPVPKDPNLAPDRIAADEAMYDKLKEADRNSMPLAEAQAYDEAKIYFKDQYGVGI